MGLVVEEYHTALLQHRVALLLKEQAQLAIGLHGIGHFQI